jgi:enterochelin esterase-like enzyme
MSLRKILLPLIFVLVFTSCGKQAEVVEVARQADNIEKLTVFSPAIEDNKVGDSPYQVVYVCLPPGYQESTKRYPVIYYLHGFDTPAAGLVLFQTGLLAARDKSGKDFIFVAITGYNKYHGSFYVNSPVTGRWEDFIVKEIVPLIDSRYRTLAKREARGLAGFSMGGMGALNLGLSHSDLFSSLWVLEPATFNEELIKDAVSDWKRINSGIILTAYSAAYSGEGSYPQFDGTEADARIIADWQKGAGNWEQKITDYLAGGKPLKGLQIVSCSQTEWAWISKGNKYLSDLFRASNIQHGTSVFNVSHTINSEIAGSSLVPFFVDNLGFE